MKRRAHILRPQTSKERPKRIVYLDSESRVYYFDVDGNPLAPLYEDGREKPPPGAVRTVHDPYLAVAGFWYQNKGYTPQYYEYVYGSPERPLAQIVQDITAFCPPRERTLLVAHNIEYDLLNLGMIPDFVRAGWHVKDYFTKGLTTILRFRRGEQTLVCQSSTNIFQTSLDEMGDLFGVPKLDVDYNRDDLATMTVYCQRDVLILKTMMERFAAFVQDEDLGMQALTVAGQSFNAYRHRFMPHPIAIHDSPEVIAAERDAYIGGRVECFRLGTMPPEMWYAVDVNSMYPAVMRKYEYPVRLSGTHFRPSRRELRRMVETGRGMVADVTITTDVPRYAMIHNKRLLFPVGTFDTTLTTPDIIGALIRNELRDIRFVAEYDVAPIFVDFVDYFYHMKATATDPIMRVFYKLILNSCYGKFGQRAETIIEIGDAEADEIYTIPDCWDVTRQQSYVQRVFGGKIFDCFRDREESFNSFAAIAAHVTAYARRTLWEGIETAGLSNVVYCDTDSIFTNNEGFLNMVHAGLVDPVELGKWDNEKQAENLVIRGPKDYTFGEKTKLKGVRKGSVQQSPDTWTTVVWPRLLGAIAIGRLDHYENVIRDKTMKREYQKGIVVPDGSVLPFRFDAGILDVTKGGATGNVKTE